MIKRTRVVKAQWYHLAIKLFGENLFTGVALTEELLTQGMTYCTETIPYIDIITCIIISCIECG